MADDANVRDVGAAGPCPDLEHQCPIWHDDAQAELTAEEAAALGMLAGIFVDAMMRLNETQGLTPKQMLSYYTGAQEPKVCEEETL